MGRQPQPGGNHGGQQAVAEPAGFAQAQHAVLNKSAAAGERKQPLLVGRVRAVERVVIVVDHVRSGVGDQREQHRQQRFEQVNFQPARAGATQANQRARQRDAEKRGPRRGKVFGKWAGKTGQAGFEWGHGFPSGGHAPNGNGCNQSLHWQQIGGTRLFAAACSLAGSGCARQHCIGPEPGHLAHVFSRFALDGRRGMAPRRTGHSVGTAQKHTHERIFHRVHLFKKRKPQHAAKTGPRRQQGQSQ